MFLLQAIEGQDVYRTGISMAGISIPHHPNYTTQLFNAVKLAVTTVAV